MYDYRSQFSSIIIVWLQLLGDSEGENHLDQYFFEAQVLNVGHPCSRPSLKRRSIHHGQLASNSERLIDIRASVASSCIVLIRLQGKSNGRLCQQVSIANNRDVDNALRSYLMGSDTSSERCCWSGDLQALKQSLKNGKVLSQ